MGMRTILWPWLCLAAFCFASNLRAVDGTWTGAVNTDWQNAGNWSGGPPLTAADTARFDLGGSVAVTNAPTALGELTVDGGTNLSMALPAGGMTLGLGTSALQVGGSLTITGTSTMNMAGGIAVFPSGSLTVSAPMVFNVPAATTFRLIGNVTLGGNFTKTGPGNLLVSLNSTLTLNGALSINGGTFGGQEDGTQAPTAGQFATLNLMGSVAINVSGGFMPGESKIHLYGNVDIGATAGVPNVTGGPGPGNDFHAEGWLLGTNQSIAFEANIGSPFGIKGIGPNTRVTQTGRMRLASDLDLSNAVGTVPFTVWNGSGGTVVIGDSQYNSQLVVTTSNGDVYFGPTVCPEVTQSGAPYDSSNSASFKRTASGTGRFVFASLTVEGDVTDNVSGAPEENGGYVEFTDCEVTVTGTLQVNDASSAAAIDGRGGLVVFFGGVTANLSNFILGNNVATQGFNGAGFGSLFGNTINMAPNSTVQVNAHGRFQLFDSTTITSAGAYTINCSVAPSTETVMFVNSTVTSAIAGGVTLSISSSVVDIRNTTFSNYSAAGLNLLAGSDLNNLSECTFMQGVAGGSHITLNGLVNVPASCDAITFDDSVGTSSTGKLVNIVGGSNALLFKAASGSDFGIGSFSMTAAQAEANDNDGTAASNVRWDDTASAVTFAMAGSQPATGIVSSMPAYANQMVLLLDLSAAGPADSVLTRVVFSLLGMPGAQLSETDIASTTLFRDANANGAYDTGEQLSTGTLNQPPNIYSEADFDLVAAGVALASRTITSGAAAQRWGLAITFAPFANGKTGTLGFVAAAAYEVAGNLVLGLPVIHLVDFSGPATQLAVTAQPSGTFAASTFATQPEVEVRDAAGNVVASEVFAVTVSIISGTPGANLGGTLTVNTVNGIANFAGLSINLPGSYTLQFAAAGLTSATSNAFNLVPPPSQLAIATQPAGANEGAAFITQPVVEIRDAGGVLVTSGSYPVTASITPATGTAGAAIVGTVTVNSVNGVATFTNLAIDLAGSGYTLTFTSSGLTAATSTPFDVAAAPVTSDDSGGNDGGCMTGAGGAGAMGLIGLLSLAGALARRRRDRR